MPLTLERIMELVRKHDAIGAEIARLDEQRAALEGERAAVKDELEGRKPGRRAAASAPVMAKATATPSSTSGAPPSKPKAPGRIEKELSELLPWLGMIQSETRRKCVQLRAAGKLPEDIAKELRLEHKAVSNAIYQGRQQLRAARQSGAKPKAEKTAASDAEDGPGAEQLDDLDAYNASTVAPVGAQDIRRSEVEHVTRMSDVGADGRASFAAGSGTCGGVGAAMASSPSALGGSTTRRPGEIDPEVDLSELVPDEPEPPAPAAEQPDDQEHAELKALAEYFPGLSPNQRFVVEGTLEGMTQERMAVRQGTSRHAIRTILSMAVARLRSLRAQATARGCSAEAVVDDATPAIARIRRKRLALLNVANGDPDARVHGATIAACRLSRDEIRAGQELEYPADVDRPRTRGECQDMPRPCPFVSCSHHLYLDVNPESGAIKLNFPHLEVWDMAETCSLDVADRDGVTLETVGAIMNVTRERIRQIEMHAMRHAAKNGRRAGIEIDLPEDDDHESPLARAAALG